MNNNLLNSHNQPFKSSNISAITEIPKKDNKKLLMLVGSFFALLILGGAVIFVMSRSGPQSSANPSTVAESNDNQDKDSQSIFDTNDSDDDESNNKANLNPSENDNDSSTNNSRDNASSEDTPTYAALKETQNQLTAYFNKSKELLDDAQSLVQNYNSLVDDYCTNPASNQDLTTRLFSIIDDANDLTKNSQNTLKEMQQFFNSETYLKISKLNIDNSDSATREIIEDLKAKAQDLENTINSINQSDLEDKITEATNKLETCTE